VRKVVCRSPETGKRYRRQRTIELYARRAFHTVYESSFGSHGGGDPATTALLCAKKSTDRWYNYMFMKLRWLHGGGRRTRRRNAICAQCSETA